MLLSMAAPKRSEHRSKRCPVRIDTGLPGVNFGDSVTLVCALTILASGRRAKWSRFATSRVSRSHSAQNFPALQVAGQFASMKVQVAEQREEMATRSFTGAQNSRSHGGLVGESEFALPDLSKIGA